MARRQLIRCIVCGSLRALDAFGLDSRGKPDTEPHYELHLAIQEIGGRGRCSWTFQDVPTDVAVEIRNRMKAALEQITEDLRRVGYEPADNG